MFDILIPVLGRPQNAQRVVDSIREATTVAYRVLFLCSPGDDAQITAARDTGAEVIICSFPSGKSDYPKKMNVGFRETEEEYLLLGADDVEFERGWDLTVLNAVQRRPVGVIGTNDLANRHVMRGLNSTHPVVSRAYIQEEGGSLDGPGTLISEEYDHNYCERELNGLAMSRRQWMFLKNVHIKHRHPCWGTAPQDETYRKGIRNFQGDRDLFYTRARAWGYTGLTNQEKTYAKNLRKRRARQARR